MDKLYAIRRRTKIDGGYLGDYTHGFLFNKLENAIRYAVNSLKADIVRGGDYNKIDDETHDNVYKGYNSGDIWYFDKMVIWD